MKLNTKAKYFKYAILVISFCLILGIIGTCTPLGKYNFLDGKDVLTTSLAKNTITYDSASSLGKFSDGNTYVFTDKSKVDDYRAGNGGVDWDFSMVRIDTGAAHGNQVNPYVIASVDDWYKFAKLMETDTTHGNGKYFVLANDIEFTTENPFYPIRFFNGNFFGEGNTLKGVSISNWQYMTSSGAAAQIGATTNGFGIFCQTNGAVVADLIVEDFSYSGPGQVGIGFSSRGTFIGVIIGYSAGNDFVLNCHTTGLIDTTNTTYTLYNPVGGIVGFHYSATDTMLLYIYRCSSEYSAKSTHSSNGMFAGGILGESFGAQTFIYDCVAKLSVEASGGTGLADSGLVGLTEKTTKIEYKNVVTTVDVIASANNFNGSLTGVNVSAASLTFENCYTNGEKGPSSASRGAMYGITGSATINSSNCTVKNFHQVKRSDLSYASTVNGTGDRLAALNISGVPQIHSNLTQLLTAAANNVSSSDSSSMSTRIWDETKTKNLITYWADGYAGSETMLDYSPVRNRFFAILSFKNLLKDDAEEDTDIADGNYLAGDELPTPTSKPNHEFLGWTMDKTGEEEPFKELPSGIFGENTLYAVWGLSNSYVTSNITTSITSDKDKIEYDGLKAIELTALVTHGSVTNGMTSPKVRYVIKQDGATKAQNTTGKLNLKTVADSGSYTFDYRITDSNEPLWHYDGVHNTGKSVTIEKGKLSLDAFQLNDTAYIGRSLSELTFDISAKNSSGNNVALRESRWKSTVGQKVVSGENTQDIRVTPQDTDNYEIADLTVKFDSEKLNIKFIFPELTEELKCEIEFGQSYGASETIYLFNSVYMDALANNSAFASVADSGLAPYLADKEEIDSNPSYKGAPIVADSSGKPLYNKVHSDVRDELSIYVFFNEVTYTVQFDANSSSNTTTLPGPAAYGYGKFVIKPSQDPTNGDLLFVGWYFEDSDGVNRAWRFFTETLGDGTVLPQDRVSGNVTLTAEWLSASDLDEVTFTVNPSAKFIALNTIDDGSYLTVTAKYSGEKDGHTTTSSKTVAYGDYVIEYGRMDGSDFAKDYTTLKVVTGGMYIRVGVEFGGTTVYSQPQRINVSPVDITDVTTHFDFGDADGDGIIKFDYDGTGKTVKKVSNSDALTISSGRITGIDYEYRNSFTGAAVTEPTDIGTYTVTISYTTVSDDFSAKPTTLTLVIESKIKVKVEWTATSLMYNGGVQHPKISKIINADTQEEITVSEGMLTYTGDTDAKEINISSNKYKVKVSLGDSYSIVEGEECSFDIVKALLEVPTFTAGTLIYDGQTKNLAENLVGFNTELMEIISGGTGKDAGTYRATVKLKDTTKCSWSDGTIGSKQIPWNIDSKTLYLDWDNWEFVSDGTSAYAPSIKDFIGLEGADSFNPESDIIYKIYDADGNLLEASQVDEVGSYTVVASFNGDIKNYTLDSTSKEWSFVVVPKSGMTVLTVEWEGEEFLYDGIVHYPTFTVKDSSGNTLSDTQIAQILTFSEGYKTHSDLGTYRITVGVKDTDNYFIRSGGVYVFKIVDENGNAPSEDETQTPSGNNSGEVPNPDGGGGGTLDLGKFFQDYWQAIASAVSIVLIIIFIAKTISYEGRRKKAQKKTEKLENAYAASVGLFGLASTYWNVIAGILMGLAVLGLVVMIIAKVRCGKAEDQLEEASDNFEARKKEQEKEEARQRDENMRMMLMGMMGNSGQVMPQQGVYGGQGIGMEDMRMMINETVSALLPGVQQMLPQQASANEDAINRLIEQNEKLMQDNAQLMHRLAERPAEKVIEKEVAVSNVNDELLRQLVEKSNKNDETISKLMEKIVELSATQRQQVVAAQPQIIERVVEKPVEKIVEKVVEKPVIHVISTDKSNVISTEAEGEAEKSQQYKKGLDLSESSEVTKSDVISSAVEKSKQVKPAPKKETAPRLTLEEAYAKLTKEQKKYFDGLREYAMKKDSKCKEKLATYFTTIGPSTTNPLIKLTIKKGVTVALFKMEDEYLKDIRRNAGSDGTKVKVKETEVPIGDAQAFDTAKDMIDLRIDQIERYDDFMKEQRAMKRK